MRILAVVPLLVALLLPVPAEAGARTDLVAALEVLHAWDARRAEAWARDDVTALGSLYVRGSRAGAADVGLLRAYEARGAVVRRLVTQVFAVQVLGRDASTLRLRVLDRVAGGEVVQHGHTTALSSSLPVARTIDLRRVARVWRVEAVSGSGSGLRSARR